jgi:hypothetical protein
MDGSISQTISNTVTTQDTITDSLTVTVGAEIKEGVIFESVKVTSSIAD